MTNPRPYRAIPIDPKHAGPDGFVYGWYAKRYVVDTPEDTIYESEGLFPIQVHPESVGQDTGEIDKNGKAIYEGDIFRAFSGSWKHDVKKFNMNPQRWLFVVSFENSCFGYRGLLEAMHVPEDMEFKPFFRDGEIDTDDYEVIGTTHDKEQENG